MKELSIITVNKNNARGLEKTLQSILPQKNLLWEYIVVDGNSNDESQQMIQDHSSTIDLAIIEEDQGIYDAMNKGIRIAKGKYLLFLNSGDWLTPDAIERITAQISSACSDILYFDTFLCFQDGKIVTQSYPKEMTPYFLWKSCLNHQSTLIRRDALISSGLYNTTLKFMSDYEFWVKSLLETSHSFAWAGSPISFYDMNGISATRKNACIAEAEQIRRVYFSWNQKMLFPIYQRYESSSFYSLYFRIARFLKSSATPS